MAHPHIYDRFPYVYARVCIACKLAWYCTYLTKCRDKSPGAKYLGGKILEGKRPRGQMSRGGGGGRQHRSTGRSRGAWVGEKKTKNQA